MKKHVFAVCAYKKSEYLEKCVKSLVSQTVKSEIIICTSTPNDYISGIAQKYGISLYVRDGKSDIRDDWNFAYDMADAELVTIAHQDDIYNKRYVEMMHKALEKSSDDFTMYFTDYLPVKNGIIGPRDINSKIRRLLRIPMKSKLLANFSWCRKSILAFGNSIVCPSVTYNKAKLGEDVFTSEMKFNIDWDTFLKLAREKGSFVYVDRPLTFYRVHDGATSKEFIENNGRIIEDTEMFCKFWPKCIAKFIMIFYKKAYDTYS